MYREQSFWNVVSITIGCKQDFNPFTTLLSFAFSFRFHMKDFYMCFTRYTFLLALSASRNTESNLAHHSKETLTQSVPNDGKFDFSGTLPDILHSMRLDLDEAISI